MLANSYLYATIGDDNITPQEFPSDFLRAALDVVWGFTALTSSDSSWPGADELEHLHPRRN